MMSAQEIDRLEIIQKVFGRQLKQVEAAELLGLSTRQMRNLQNRYLSMGAEGLMSQRRGKPSNNQLPSKMKATAYELIQTHYSDFGPTLAHEKLTEQHGLKLSIESVRQLMIKHGFWQGKRRKVAHIHPSRARPC